MADTTSGKCGLCEKESELCRSHVIPEFLYRPLYDEEKRFALRFHPDRPLETRKIQTGIWDRLLCSNCEQLVGNQYEAPFKRYWEENACRLDELQTADLVTLTGIDYGPFKLFHLSVLLRASLTTRGEFAAVDLGAGHESELRRAVLFGDAPPPNTYPIVCCAIESPFDGGPWREVVASPERARLHGARAYAFYFGGCTWMYLVASHDIPAVRELCLQSDGTLHVAQRAWERVRRAVQSARRGRAEG